MSDFIPMGYLLTGEGLAAVSWITCDNCTCFALMFNLVERMTSEVPLTALMESGTLTSELPCGGRCVLGLREEHSQLTRLTYTFNLRGEIQLEKKEDMIKRGLDSPDRADALALTFAYPMAPHELAGGEWPRKTLVQHEYDPFEIRPEDYNPFVEVHNYE